MPAPNPSDRLILADVRERLTATGRFAAVVPGRWPDVPPEGSPRPLAVVGPLAWDEDDAFDPTRLFRTLKGVVAIIVYDPGDGSEYDELDRLANVVVDAITYQALGRVGLPDFTRATAGEYHPPTHPDRVLEVRFTTSYYLDPKAPRSTK